MPAVAESSARPAAISAGPVAGPEVVCAHCGLPVAAGDVEPEAERQFCCNGCRTAWRILHEHGLDQYYAIAEPLDHTAPRADDATGFAAFDHAAFHELYVRDAAEGLKHVELFLEGVHCAACVWLVERVPLILPGVARTELDIGRAVASIDWDPSTVPLSEVARLLNTLGYRPHPFRRGTALALRRREDRAMLARIGVAGAIAGNVMLASLALYSGWLSGMEHNTERYFRWLSLLITIPAIVWPGLVFFRGALGSLKARALNMDVPIALALAAGFTRGALNTITDHGPIYFDGVTGLIFLLLVGRYLQQRSQRAAADSAELLFALTPQLARVVEEGEVREVPVEAVLPGMELDVRAGDTVPADGHITTGRSSIDRSLLSGESRAVEVSVGDEVFAGTLNLGGAIRLRVDAAGETTRVGRLMQDVESAARRRAPVVRLADRISGWFVAAVLALALFTFVLWLRRDPSAAADNAIALLIVTCPCALALATPLAVTSAIGRAAKSGILIKGGDALERLARPGHLWLDKTGTLTEGGGALTLEQWSGAVEVRPLVLALEAHSAHPIAEAFRRAWPDVQASNAMDVRQTTGGGLEGVVDGHHVVLGSSAFVSARLTASAVVSNDAPMTDFASDRRGGIHAAGERAVGPASAEVLPNDAKPATPVVVALDGTLVARASFGDPVRADAADALGRLRRAGWRTTLLSGDDPKVVERVARELGFGPGEWRGGATPEDKLRLVESDVLAGQHPVVMVGDGVNDAAAIAAADVGIGVHGGVEASLSAADVYLTRPGVSELARLTEGSARTMRLIRRLMMFSLAYNVAGASLAIAGRMHPLIAALLMPASSLTVVIAAWRARTFADRV